MAGPLASRLGRDSVLGSAAQRDQREDKRESPGLGEHGSRARRPEAVTPHLARGQSLHRPKAHSPRRAEADPAQTPGPSPPPSPPPARAAPRHVPTAQGRAPPSACHSRGPPNGGGGAGPRGAGLAAPCAGACGVNAAAVSMERG